MTELFSEPASREDALTPAVLLWGGTGTCVQIALVVAGHYNDAVYSVWPAPLLATAAVSGAAYVIHKRRSLADSAWHGGVVGGICTFLGTALAAVMADVAAMQLVTMSLGGIAVGGVAGSLAFAALRLVSPARGE